MTDTSEQITFDHRRFKLAMLWHLYGDDRPNVTRAVRMMTDNQIEQITLDSVFAHCDQLRRRRSKAHIGRESWARMTESERVGWLLSASNASVKLIAPLTYELTLKTAEGKTAQKTEGKEAAG